MPSYGGVLRYVESILRSFLSGFLSETPFLTSIRSLNPCI
jgi:hypothetical protein